MVPSMVLQLYSAGCFAVIVYIVLLSVALCLAWQDQHVNIAR